MSNKQRAGVIGLGPIGNKHADIYRELPTAELVGVCDIDRARADAAGTRLAVPRFYSVDEMLANTELNLVSVATGGEEYGGDHFEPTRHGEQNCQSHNECPAGYCYQGRCEAYHCTGEPDLIDPWRTALLLGALHESGNIRVIGVDGRVGPVVDPIIDQFCDDGWLSRNACRRISVTWEEEDQGAGWFRFHHHHMHVSMTPPVYGKPGGRGPVDAQCLVPGCDAKSLDTFLRGRGITRGPSGRIPPLGSGE